MLDMLIYVLKCLVAFGLIMLTILFIVLIDHGIYMLFQPHELDDDDTVHYDGNFYRMVDDYSHPGHKKMEPIDVLEIVERQKDEVKTQSFFTTSPSAHPFSELEDKNKEDKNEKE